MLLRIADNYDEEVDNSNRGGDVAAGAGADHISSGDRWSVVIALFLPIFNFPGGEAGGM